MKTVLQAENVRDRLLWEGANDGSANFCHTGTSLTYTRTEYHWFAMITETFFSIDGNHALTLDSCSQACFCFGQRVICFKLATHLGSETDFVCESSWVRSIQLKCVLNFHVWNPFALPHTYHFQSVVNSIQRLATGIFRNIVKLVLYMMWQEIVA